MISRVGAQLCKRYSCSLSKKTQDAADLLAKVETDSWSEQGATSRWKGRPKDRSGVEQESLRGRRARRSLSLALEGSKPSFCSAMKLINPRSGMKHSGGFAADVVSACRVPARTRCRSCMSCFSQAMVSWMVADVIILPSTTPSRQRLCASVHDMAVQLGARSQEEPGRALLELD